ncbi:DEAD/DEAH box helicase [Kaistia dalseonensis]|uniref:ATP-dependent RNA helicase DeaD n=1 Tax=Kaistia dalseonensis TaxID=410840 RepID=A0ABU0H327_9HYPH|nr:DEAD/DEAH box helicase [Kaistia dalseonensis]MCX5494120.1 DEAD/DEAH box helicase [Kaistia dalseonensis]MDQ0436699.1 ATP-dependent RNA helicase DeaD [Kaistia dalseonensis]
MSTSSELTSSAERPSPVRNPALARALAARGYESLTPVQAAVVEERIGENDLLVSAQTGSGKTVAYGLAFATTLLGTDERFGPANEPLALVIAPTRELAQQVQREFEWLYAETGARIASCVGGMDVRREARALEMGAHIVVGTPGRLRDHLERGRLDISKLKVVVLDEADEMLDLGFREDLELILDASPAERRTMLFSATLPREIVRLARQYQRDAIRIDTIVQNQPHGDIEYHAIRVAPNEVELAVVNVLRFSDVPATLVFCATRDSVRHLHASLQERGFAAVALSGELSQTERMHALQALRDGRARVCVATDVAARGLDLPDLGLVIHADLPTGPAVLLHRSGRTGRAGRKGISALLVPFNARNRAQRLIAAAGVEAKWMGPPSADEIRSKDQKRLMEDPLLLEAPSPEDQGLVQALLAGRTPEQIAAALIRMQRATLPAPEELYDPGQQEARGPREGRNRDDRSHDRQDAPKSHRRGPESLERAARREQEEGSHPPKEQQAMVWFRIGVGRQKNADPKWLLPLICRRGHVTKNEIGAIKIMERDSRFEIVAEAAERFATALRRSDDEDIRIEPADAADIPAGAGSKGRPAKSGPAGKGAPRDYARPKPRRAGFKPRKRQE